MNSETEPWQVEFRPFLRAASANVRAEWQRSPRHAPAKLLAVALFLLKSCLQRNGRVSEAVYRQREAHCKACLLYNAALQTCGTPGETTSDQKPFGCGCYLPAKNHFHVSCWLWLHTNHHHGWPDNLNSDHYQNP